MLNLVLVSATSFVWEWYSLLTWQLTVTITPENPFPFLFQRAQMVLDDLGDRAGTLGLALDLFVRAVWIWWWRSQKVTSGSLRHDFMSHCLWVVTLELTEGKPYVMNTGSTSKMNSFLWSELCDINIMCSDKRQHLSRGNICRRVFVPQCKFYLFRKDGVLITECWWFWKSMLFWSF